MYYATIMRGEKTYYVTMPVYGAFTLSLNCEGSHYWLSEASCNNDQRWKPLIQRGDVVRTRRSQMNYNTRTWET